MILITGSNGQLGIALSSLLTKADRKFTALTHQSLDITNFENVSHGLDHIKPTAVINCAAYNEVDKAEQNWLDAYRINGLGVRNLAVACEKNKIPFVCVGTDFVFDGKSDKPYTIADQPNPINAYGKSKLLGEKFLTTLAKRFYLVRTSCVFGQGKNNFLTKVLSWSTTNKVLKIVDDQVSSPTLAIDLAAAILKLLETGIYGLYHYHNLGQCSRYEWAKYALEKINWQGKIEPVKSNFFSTPAKRPEFSVLDLFPITEMGIQIPTWEEATSRWLEDYK